MPANFPAKCTETRRAKVVDVDRELRDFGVREVIADDATPPPCVALMGKDDLRVLKLRTIEIYQW